MTSQRNQLIRWTAVIALSIAIAVGACSDDGDETATTDTTEETTTSADESSTTDSTASTSTSEASTTTSTAPSTTTTGGGPTTLPGEEFIGYVNAGDILGVVGVRHDDVLNVRALPGTDQPVVVTADPTDIDLIATGRARLLPASIWFEITNDGTTGWANSRFLGHVGGTDDVTSAFLAEYGERPVAETLVQLGELVADEFASEDPPSRIVNSVAPSVGDLGEITYDVIGLGDDSVLGFRLHLFAVEGEGGESFELTTIEQTVFCIRGTAGEICT